MSESAGYYKFAGWAFPDSSRELKMIEFEQLRQSEHMGVEEFTDKFLLRRYGLTHSAYKRFSGEDPPKSILSHNL